ncbi:glutamate-1-semialdehyde 2,1-aminomutase [Draconibacterium sediminis]|uniref:Glutamate-1-semialdehyde 2,1-aminomutase n=1 Tax=Draconibacterium sediminis TaxID=1544798 RepID=A0A0D8J6M4_9BACT|nr:glutamate-1-semialdehyde 2,1-aminomutase [Draconibacterium sediminis]KJF42625.1 glutamate-1-semialdehyde aminotransferase [Draconibacterium sediminis]
MQFSKSIEAFQQAQQSIPGGVNSPVRAFKSVNLNPVFIDCAKGSTVVDIDGNQYTDFVSSWGPLIFGHAHPEIVSAINKAAQKGTSYGAPTLYETEMAELIVEMVPSIEKVRMVNSGTEATMSAIRLARGTTGREKIVKFVGNYHGHGDSFLIKAGSGAITLGLPDSPGVTAGNAKDTLLANYNDLASVEQLFAENGENIAAIIVEPVAGNMGVVLPEKGFLEGLREIATKNGALLIFDEVITGFRLAKGGAQEYFNVMPDITTLGKIIGGGLPVGAYGGKKEIMDQLAPNGPIYQAGTLSGNPLAMAAGSTMLKLIRNTADFYPELERKAKKLEEGIRNNLKETGIKAVLNRVGSMMTLFFTNEEKVSSYEEAMSADTTRYAKYFKLSLESGMYIAPSQFECLFVSYAHSDEDIDNIIAANLNALKELKRLRED